MTDLIRWEPMRRMSTLRDAIDRLFEENLMRYGDGWSLFDGDDVQTLALDVSETEDTLTVEASLPGVDPKDVDISVVGNNLTIKAEKKHEEEKEEKGKYYRRERRYGLFQRSITLPTEVNANAATATFEKGELKLTLPKVEAVKPKHIEIKSA